MDRRHKGAGAGGFGLWLVAGALQVSGVESMAIAMVLGVMGIMLVWYAVTPWLADIWGRTRWRWPVAIDPTKEDNRGQETPPTIEGSHQDRIASRQALREMGLAWHQSEFIEQARRGEAETVRLFLVGGMDANVVNGKGETALHRAAYTGSLDAARELLRGGIRVNAQDQDGFTALMVASSRGHAPVVRLLLEHGADTECRTRYGESTALFLATFSNNVDNIRLLLHHGAAVDSANAQGTTPLMLAARRGRYPVVEALIQAGADPFVQDNAGANALDYALSEERSTADERKSVVALLRDKGVTPADPPFEFSGEGTGRGYWRITWRPKP